MSPTIPSFGDAIKAMRGMLPQRGDHTPLLWLTREDFYAVRVGWYYHTPRPSCDPSLFSQYYEAGRSRGLVSVHAMFHSGSTIACTVWYPQSEEESVQGWQPGLRVSMAAPLGIAAKPGSLLGWKPRTLTPQYRRYTSFSNQVPTAAEVRGASR